MFSAKIGKRNLCFQESDKREKTKKHNRHFIGHHIGGVGGVFPPVLKNQHKEHFEKHLLAFGPKPENVLQISEDFKLIHDNSTCVHDNQVYHAGQTVSIHRFL